MKKLLQMAVKMFASFVRPIRTALIVRRGGVYVDTAGHPIRTVLNDRRGEGYVDTAVKILMAVVIGALVLGGLYALFGDLVMPTLTRRIQEMFNYAG